MPITTHRKPDRDLSIFVCEGSLSLNEIIAVIERFFQGTVAPPTNKILWDIRIASIDNLTADHVSQIADLVGGYRSEVKDTKIAVVVSEKLNTDIAKNFKAKSKDALKHLMVFRKIDEATKWLEKDKE